MQIHQPRRDKGRRKLAETVAPETLQKRYHKYTGQIATKCITIAACTAQTIQSHAHHKSIPCAQPHPPRETPEDGAEKHVEHKACRCDGAEVRPSCDVATETVADDTSAARCQHNANYHQRSCTRLPCVGALTPPKRLQPATYANSRGHGTQQPELHCPYAHHHMKDLDHLHTVRNAQLPIPNRPHAPHPQMVPGQAQHCNAGSVMPCQKLPSFGLTQQFLRTARLARILRC